MQIQPENLLANKPKEVRDLYDYLYKKCQKLGRIRIDTTLSCIYFMDTDRFLAIKPRRDGLILEFALNRREDVFPVIHILAISKSQYMLRVKINTKEDLEGQIFSWINEAYLLKSGETRS